MEMYSDKEQEDKRASPAPTPPEVPTTKAFRAMNGALCINMSCGQPHRAGKTVELICGYVLYRNVLAKTQAECKAKLREAIRNVQQEDGPTPAKPTIHYTVGEWLRTWFELYSKPNLRETTQEQYTNFLEKHLIPNIGNIPLNRLTSLQLQTLYQELHTSGRVNVNKKAGPGLSPKTVRGIHMLLHNALEQAVKEELIKKNPTDGYTPPKLERKEMKVIQSFNSCLSAWGESRRQ